MQQPRIRRLVSIAATVLLASSLIACTETGAQSQDTVKLGVLLPLKGPYEPIASDIRDAFELYIKANGGKLGGRNVDISSRDEGGTETDPAKASKTAAAAAHKLTAEDGVDVIVGGLASTAYVPTAYEATKAEVPFIGTGGVAELEKDKADPKWLWQTSYDPTHSGEAIAPYIKDEVDGPVYAMGPDYPGGYVITGSFSDPFKKLGGKLANPDNEPAWTPWPNTKDFNEYFDEAADTGAKAIYAFYAGQPSIDFVKQWAKSKAKDIPLYGTYLTDGATLTAQGEAAVGVRNSMNYSPTIDNAPNRTFVSEWSAEHPDRLTNGVTLTGWDTGLVLDRALSSIPADEEATPSKIAAAIAKLGRIDSPRGTWQFNKKTHLPIQKWYLTTVEQDGPTLSNVVLQELDTMG